MDDRLLELFEDFAARRARGERPDPLPYIEGAGADAQDMRRMIERLVMSAPPPAPASGVVAMMRALAEGEPPLLGARLHRRLAVDAVATGLVELLGLRPERRDKVRRLYQRLEGGLLDATLVDPRLVTALAQTLGISERDVALGAAPAGGGADAIRFARAAPPGGIAALERAHLRGPLEEPDEVDRLFGVA